MVNLDIALPKYLKILKGRLKPRFKKTRLEPKIKRAFEMLKDCEICERACHVDRTQDELGYCRVGGKMAVSGQYVGNNDLSFLGKSHDVFFLGCVLKCVFCHNSETSQVKEDRLRMSEQGLAKIIDSRSTSKLVDFVGGDPAPQLPFALKILSHVQKDIPIMWNSCFYMTEESMDLLRGVVDVYSPDFKYGNDKCAKRLSNVKNYTEIVKRNHKIAFEDSEVISRHLIMPNHIDCCSKPVIDFLADTFGDKVIVHLMDQYGPVWRAKQHPDINRRLRKKELDEVVDYAEKKGLNYIVES